MAYQLCKSDPLFPNAIACVRRLSDNATIPFDEGNLDYREYLAWCAAGHTPLPAE